jgi:phenylalanine-4-hydroxylase
MVVREDRAHPGLVDPAYRERRAAIAELTADRHVDAPIPVVSYNDDEEQVWNLVAGELATKHTTYACHEYRDAAARLALPLLRIPQLCDVSADLSRISGFEIEPVPGLVPTRTFYGSLARRRFMSTQYVRHHSVPFYTPEPDVIHELIGHCNTLASPVLARLYEAAGRASLRATTAESLEFFSRVWWFTAEFGVVWEGGELRAYGAGLLSSYGELDAFRAAEIRPFDIMAMGTMTYDITHYQPILFAGRSMPDIEAELLEFWNAYDDVTYRRITTRSRQH